MISFIQISRDEGVNTARKVYGGELGALHGILRYC